MQVTSSSSSALRAPPQAPEARSPNQTDASQESEPGAAPVDRISLTNKLTEEEQILLDELKSRDRDVRAHEAAHQAAGGSLAGAASFTYQQGPDGKSYAIGGEVSIAFGEGSTPSETIAHARQVRAAALAPADPSGQDLRVAAEASALELRATLELSQQSQRTRAASRGTHLHSSEPCGSCSRVVADYAKT